MHFELRTPARGVTGPWRRKNVERLNRAAARATDKAAIGARDELRAGMRSRGLGKLANAIGATSDLKRQRTGRGGKLDVAGFVTRRGKSPRTIGALQAYLENDATTIAPVRGRWLAFATKEIPQRVGRRRMTPALYRSSGLEEKIGPLVFVRGRKAGMAYLVAKDVTIRLARAGQVRKLPKTGRIGAGRARVGIVAFVLVRQTRRSRRVAPREVAARWKSQMPALLRAALGEQ